MLRAAETKATAQNYPIAGQRPSFANAHVIARRGPLYPSRPSYSNTLDRHGPLAIQLGRIPLVALLLAVLEPLALVVLEQAVLPAEVARAEAAVADDALGGVLALLEGAPDLLGGHAAAQGECHVQDGVGRQGEAGEGFGRGGEVLAGVHEAQVGLGEVVAEGEEGGEGGY